MPRKKEILKNISYLMDDNNENYEEDENEESTSGEDINNFGFELDNWDLD